MPTKKSTAKRSAPKPSKKKTAKPPSQTKSYVHTDADSPMRPDVGTQPLFRQKKPPTTFQHTPSVGLKPREDSSTPPNLEWDGQNPVRETGEALIREILEADDLAKAKSAASKLKAMSQPFLNWVGKAERLSFDVPTLPLFVHERLSTKAIIDTLKSHRKDRGVEQQSLFELFGDPQRPIADQVLRAYEHGPWTNRMILGDSLVVMNSLLQYEGLGGKVQMIYMDPPYGVKFGSNFQPFVRKRDVSHGDDEDMTREPETVKAYRDTWEVGLHSYLTYLRDRLILSWELLSLSGSIFVQINDENLVYLRNILDEVFGADNLVVTIPVKKKGGQKSDLLDPVNDYLLWYTKDQERGRKAFSPLYEPLTLDSDLVKTFRCVELTDGRELTLTQLTKEYGGDEDFTKTPQRVMEKFPGARIFKSENLTGGRPGKSQAMIYRYKSRTFDPGVKRGLGWKHSAVTDDGTPSGMDRLAASNRLYIGDEQLGFKRYFDDFGYTALSNWWDGLGGAGDPIYAVQTNEEIIKRCLLMTTRPGDLVLDPTCGSGTTAKVAEEWGRRWITVDVSRVPLALARQRVLTKTFPWYKLKDDARGPGSGFEYSQKQDRRGKETGGIVPHITSTTIANNLAPQEEVLVDKPEVVPGVTRVTGPFTVEAMIPTPIDWDGSTSLTTSGDGKEDSGAISAEGRFGSAHREQKTYFDRMLEVLRKSPVLHLTGGKTVAFHNVRQPARTLSLSAEASVEATANGQAPTLTEAIDEADDKRLGHLPLTHKPVAIVFGPENGAMSETLIFEAAKEAEAKKYTHLYAIGFAIQANARVLIEKCREVVGIPATYVQATPDLMMGDLLKNMRSSQIFSVCGLPEIKLSKVKPATKDGPSRYQVELLGLDVFDPVTMEVEHRQGDDVPAWFLDSDYNGLCFHVTQAFFPRTGAWENLKKALKATHDESVWDHLAGATSAPFEPGEHGQIAVKVIDDRGNELLVTKKLSEAG